MIAIRILFASLHIYSIGRPSRMQVKKMPAARAAAQSCGQQRQCSLSFF
jgi:hypothetical protein